MPHSSHWLSPGLRLSVTCLLSGCVSVSVDARNCEIPCLSSCPAGFACRGGACVRQEQAGECPSSPNRDAGGKDVGSPDAGSDAVDAAAEKQAISEAPDVGATVLDPCSPQGDVRLSPCPLPAACLGVPYSQQLTAIGGSGSYVYAGSGPYAWAASALPPGLALSSSGELSGTPTQSGALAFDLTSSSGPGSEPAHAFSLPLEARDRCWFAYSGNAGDTSYVELLDPILDGASSSRVRLPAAAEAVVSDFAFSPDGQLLAVRTRDGGGFFRLSVFEAPLWRELHSTAPDARSVIHYAWAPDSSVLALSVQDTSGTYLTGLRFAENGAAELGSRSVSALGEVRAAAGSELVWYAGNRVAFHATLDPAEPSLRRLHDAVLGQAGAFLAPVERTYTTYFTDATSSLRLEPGDDGVFVISSFDAIANIDFHPINDPSIAIVSHAQGAILSPRGRNLARSSPAGALEVYPGPSTAPVATIEGCSRFLAWSPAGDRLACVTDDPGFGGLRIFDLDAAARALTMERVEGRYVYSEEAAVLRRRAFSPRGNRFAFTTDDSLYVAEAGTARWLVDSDATPFYFDAANPFVDLSFSPDERWLLTHRGAMLFLRDLSSPADQALLLQMQLPASEACAEVEGATSHRWCGDGAPETTPMVWAPDSNAVAYRVMSASLPALTFTPSAGDRPVFLQCGSGCTHFAFQP